MGGVDTGNAFSDFAVRTTLSAMVGGTTNVAMGGSFAEGARNGARIMLMNEMGGYFDRYYDFVRRNLIQLSYTEGGSLIIAGPWPKSLVPHTKGRPAALGSKNPLTSVARASRLPGGKVIGRFVTPFAAPMAVGIGMYNSTILMEGLVYAIE